MVCKNKIATFVRKSIRINLICKLTFYTEYYFNYNCFNNYKEKQNVIKNLNIGTRICAELQ